MKKISLLSMIFLLGFTVSAFAVELGLNQTTSCKDANSIEIAVATIPNTENSSDFGYSSNDRGTANLVIWKSSNFTTIPISLGPNDNNQSLMGTDKGRTGLSPMGGHGASKVVLSKQTVFSRGDSIGDISGLVKITNTGTNPVTVKCN